MSYGLNRLILALAASVALAACTTPAQPAPAASIQRLATPAPRFDAAIAAFGEQDKANPPPKCAILFVGSSTIRFWSSLKEDFPKYQVINRGFGGSTVWEINHYFDQVVKPYQPKQIVYYAGDNDIGSSHHSPEQVYADFQTFMKLKTEALGKTPVWFIALKPSKLRFDMLPEMQDVNARVKAMADRRDDLAFIDIVPMMLKPDGTPKDIFREDGLHMTPEGYKLWTPLVEAALDAGQRGKAPSCN